MILKGPVSASASNRTFLLPSAQPGIQLRNRRRNPRYNQDQGMDQRTPSASETLLIHSLPRLKKCVTLQAERRIRRYKPNDCKAEVTPRAAGRRMIREDPPDPKRRTQKKRPRTNTSRRPPSFFTFVIYTSCSLRTRRDPLRRKPESSLP